MTTTIIELLVEESLLAPPVPPEPGNGEVVHNQNMVLNAQNRLISVYRRGPRNRAFLEAIVGQTQELEDSAYTLYVLTRLPGALGVNLDVLGRLVGELRAGRADEDYRASIRTRILVNNSDGKVEQLIAIVRSLLPTAVVRAAEYWPPAVSFAVDSIGSVTFGTMNRLLLEAKAAGVRLEFTVGAGTLGSEDDSYLGGTMGSEDDTTLGFSLASGT